MAITYPISLPTTPAPRSVSISKMTQTGVSISPFTYAEQVNAWSGESWQAEVTMPPMSRAAAEEWLAFALSLRGRFGTFLMGDPSAKTPRGVATGTPLVDGAGQTGRELATKGWTNGVTGILKKGDWLQLGSSGTARLHKVLSDANSDGAGKVVLDITPALRSSPADSAAIVISSPVGQWRMADNMVNWNVDMVRTFGFSFRAVEAL